MEAWLNRKPGNNVKPVQSKQARAAAAASEGEAAQQAALTTAAGTGSGSGSGSGTGTASAAAKGKGKAKQVRALIDPARQPWVEKYRPKNIDDVSAQDHTVAVLRKTLGSANLPHMLFYGPPGTGKTSTILALCRQLFGPELMKTRVLELNASDERGISVVREKIKTFAKISVSQPDPAFPSPPYKIIILDEADSMTQDAQSALRRIMETYSRITRFCLICNYVTRIIEPITSRCSKFRFKALDTSSTRARLEHICTQEQIAYNPESLDALIRVSDGDLRRAITYLQSASRLHNTADDPITPYSVQEIGGVIPDARLAELVDALGVEAATPQGSNGDGGGGDTEMKDVRLKSKSGGAKSDKGGFARVRSQVEKIVREGYSASQILIQLHDLLILDPLLPSRAKSGIALALGEADKSLNDGADEELQILHLCLQIRAAVVRG